MQSDDDKTDSKNEISKRVINILESRGLGEKERAVYCFLVRRGSQTAGEITKKLKNNRVQTYRILRRLEEKGVVESVIESPMEFMAVPFEILLESEIEKSLERVEYLSKNKEQILDYMRPDTIFSNSLFPNRFSLIRGRKMLHRKSFQLIERSEKALMITMNNFDVARFHQHGEIDEIDARSHIQARIIIFFSNTSTYEDTIPVIDDVLHSSKHIKFRYLDLDSKFQGLTQLPFFLLSEKECIYRLNEEEIRRGRPNEIALWTNSKSFVDVQKSIFEDFWERTKDLTDHCLWPD